MLSIRWDFDASDYNVNTRVNISFTWYRYAGILIHHLRKSRVDALKMSMFTLDLLRNYKRKSLYDGPGSPVLL